MAYQSKKKIQKISRREFIRLSALTAAGAVATACSTSVPAPAPQAPAGEAVAPTEAPVQEVAQVASKTSRYSEAPQLADLVQAGKLPPIEERLPPQPVVVEPLDEVGVYGGKLRTVMVKDRTFQVRSAYGPDGILRVSRDLKTIEPNLADSWEYSDDGKTFTLHLHEGLRWSDGEPWDANSIEYWWVHDNMNPELSPASRIEFRQQVDGEWVDATFEKIDDTTVSWTFPRPSAVLPLHLAHWIGVNMLAMTCKHYLQQFHVDFVDDPAQLTAMAQEEGFESWTELYLNRRGDASYGMPRFHPEMPTLTAYKLKKPLEGNLWVADRNPYYWKVDTAGNQLPYIDEVIITNAETPEVANAMIAAGEVNFSNGFVTSLDNYALYKENEENGHYGVRMFHTSEGASLLLQPNQTCQDPVLREIFQDLRFRQALSHALDRDTINMVVFQGLGVPFQTHVIPPSKFYVEEYAKAFTEFDVDQANQLLDDMGLTERDGEGFRLRPDGKRLVINLEYSAIKTTYTPLAELLVDMWGDIGLEVSHRLVSDDILDPRVQANEVEFGMWHGDKSSDVLFPIVPMWWVPYEVGWERQWGIEWARWFQTGGEEGQEPPEEIKQVYDNWQQLQSTLDEDEFIRLGKAILQSQAENLWTIGTIGEVPEPMIVGDNLKNYPEKGYTGYDWLGTYPYHAEQLFFEGGKWSGEPG
jgi:peptide/nickel transport system substrate-binding protein